MINSEKSSARLLRFPLVFAFLLAGFSLFSTTGFGQEVTIQATIDTNAIRIGDQFRIDLSISHPSDIRIEWPTVADTFSLMEIVNRSKIDTVADKQSKSIVHKQRLILTSFDSGYPVIPPFSVQYKLPGDTTLHRSETEPILISVATIAIDTSRTIRDIKDQEQIPFAWQDALPYVFGVILLVLIVWLVKVLIKKNRKKAPLTQALVPLRPAHEIALEALQELDESKLWQKGNFKGYYTRLSDIIRIFIENRWGINAMEMTTDEILGLQVIRESAQVDGQGLSYMLRMADLVKFAKATPIHHENEQCMKVSVSYVKLNAVEHPKAEVVS